MHPTQSTRGRELLAKGFTVMEVASVIGCTLEQARGLKLANERDKLLRRVPGWWCGEPHEYVRCVVANFGANV